MCLVNFTSTCWIDIKIKFRITINAVKRVAEKIKEKIKSYVAPRRNNL